MIRRALAVCVCVAGCAPKALPPLAPVAPCASAPAPDSTWRLVDVAIDSLVMRLPLTYAVINGTWVRRGNLVAIRAIADTLARLEAHSGAAQCETLVAGRHARIVTSASYGDFGPAYTVQALWPAAAGQWIDFQGVSQTATGQMELLSILHSVRRR